MKHLIPIVGILLLASCHTNVESNVQDSALTGTKEKVYEMEYAAPYKVAGRFLSSEKVDTLYFRRYSEKTHRFVDSLPIWGDDYMLGDDIDWFRQNGIVMRVLMSDGRIVHTDESAMFVPAVIALPDIMPKQDLLAVVWRHQDISGIKPCHIISLKDGQWTELGSFTVNTNIFPDNLSDGMIDGFLEKRNGIWMFSDWTEQLQYEGECPMRPLRNILNTNAKKYDFQENIDYLCYWGYGHDEVSKYSIKDSCKVDSIAKKVRNMNLRMTPYNTLSEIKKEFNRIFDNWFSTYDYFQRDMLENILRSRMQFHFSNPITYRYWKPTTDYSPLKVAASPDGKFKFFTTRNISSGTMGWWMTFYQYIDSTGTLVCKEWQGDRRIDCQGNVLKVWQFDYNDTTFYVLKSVWKGSSCEWGYNMEIVTFDNVEPTYHIHFFPDMNDYNEIKKLSYVNGELEESDWVREGGSYCVSYTSRFLDVDYSFNPKTLTVTATTQADTESVCKVEKWKLRTKKQ